MRKSFILLTALSFLIIASAVYAHGPGIMMGGQGWNYCPYCGQYLGQGGGYGMMGPGMMGSGMMGMMGRGMMGGGMMGGGYGMGPGMMGPGMMNPGYYGYSEECQKFLDDTAKLRKELHTKRYDYFETIRNPKATSESVANLEKEIRELQEKIYAKAPQGCWWQ